MKAIINKIQDRLDFKNWVEYPQFSSKYGLGRVALIACILSSIFTAHAMVLCLIALDKLGITKMGLSDSNKIPILSTFISPQRFQLIFQWILYVLWLCIFHLAEFFVTALYNPSVVEATSFVVNHSKAYTTAMMVSWTEFFIRFFFFPSWNNKPVAIFGFLLVTMGQVTRSLAMITCGESFNHIIQSTKKKNHHLVSSGIYKYLRHPSYFGFYYWSVGTQLLLGNVITSACFAIASWLFFKKRIPFEEQTLLKIFPDEYPSYRENTYIGIPFISTGESEFSKKSD